MKIIKTYESFNLEELDLGRFSDRIDKSLLIPNSDGTYDYNGSLFLDRIKLKSLEELPIRFRNVNGSFSCSNNKLISLQYAPQKVKRDFYCSNNKLISLQYAPLEIGIDFYSQHNFLLSNVCSPDVKYRSLYYDIDYENDSFKISEDAINTVKALTNEQQIAELNFFGKYDKDAYEMMLEILYDLGVDVEYRKEVLDDIKEKPNLKALGL